MNSVIVDNVQYFLEWSSDLYHSRQSFTHDEDKLINY